MMEREPFHSLEMEMATLGSAMLHLDMAAAIRKILPNPKMFYRPVHQDIWETILFLLDKGLPVEALFVIERLELGHKLEQIGGQDIVLQIADYVPSPDSGEFYAKHVLDCWAKREYERIIRGMDGKPLDEIHIELEAVKEGVSVHSAVPVIQVLGTLSSEAPKGVPTPWESINNLMTSRGLPSGQFTIIRADTGDGKTPWMTQCCIEAAKAGRRPLFATFADLSAQELESRAMKYLTSWAHAPNKLDLNAWWHEERKALKNWNIEVYDASSMETGFDIETFRSWVEHNQEKKGYTEIYLDYLQEIKTRQKGTILEQITEVCSQIKQLAKKLMIPCVAGSQITFGKDGQRDMAKGGRVADEKAATVFDLRPNEDNTGGELKVSKNRFGQKKIALPYEFDQEKLRFIL